MDPTLGVNDIGDTCTGSTEGELEIATRTFTAQEVFFQRSNFLFAVNHELNVISGCKAQISVTMLRSDLRDLANMLGTHKTTATNTNGVYFIATVSLVHQHASFKDLMICPFTKVIFDNRRQKIIKITRTNICDPVFHRFTGIISR